MASPSSEAAPLFNVGGGSTTLRLVGYLILACLVMFADHRNHYLRGVRHWAEGLLDPLYWVAASPKRLADSARQALRERSELAQENARLREALLLSQARLSRLASVQDQNARLRELLDARTRLGLKAQLAELIEVDLDPFRHRVMIDRGKLTGVDVGQAIMDAHGVMGQVVESFDQRATCILITDAGHAIPVRVVRTGLRTIAFGTGDVGTLRLPHVPFSADLRVGDQLVTSGLGGHFPSGLPVGTVRKVEPDDSATFVLAQATPAAGLSRSGEVLVIHDVAETIEARTEDMPELVGPPEDLNDSAATEATQ
jgi:rod shape-determining protein MreC